MKKLVAPAPAKRTRKAAPPVAAAPVVNNAENGAGAKGIGTFGCACGRHWSGLVECHCGSCHAHFSHVNNFDLHRAGTYSPDRRHCLSIKQMLALRSSTGKPLLVRREGPNGITWTRG